MTDFKEKARQQKRLLMDEVQQIQQEMQEANRARQIQIDQIQSDLRKDFQVTRHHLAALRRQIKNLSALDIQAVSEADYCVADELEN